MIGAGDQLRRDAEDYGTRVIEGIISEKYKWPMNGPEMIAADDSTEGFSYELVKTRYSDGTPALNIYLTSRGRKSVIWDITRPGGSWDIRGKAQKIKDPETGAVTGGGQMRSGSAETYLAKLKQWHPDDFIAAVGACMKDLETAAMESYRPAENLVASADPIRYGPLNILIEGSVFSEAAAKVKDGKRAVKDLRRVDIGDGHLLFGIAPQKDGKWVGITPKASRRFGNKKAAVRWFLQQAPQIAAKMGFRDELKAKKDKAEGTNLAEVIDQGDLKTAEKMLNGLEKLIRKMQSDEPDSFKRNRMEKAKKSLSEIGSIIGI